ncbi:MAG TPA: hypothetical protein VFD63_20110 [Pyrinomonadaceae bacterium]|nr:hypothetical protein [Pyrinomonadaceae bacterium]
MSTRLPEPTAIVTAATVPPAPITLNAILGGGESGETGASS